MIGGIIMYKDVGKSIKKFASVLCAIGIIFSILGGIAVALAGMNGALSIPVAQTSVSIAMGVFVAAVGSLLAWLSNLLLYGFGELVDKTAEIAENTRNRNL